MRALSLTKKEREVLRLVLEHHQADARPIAQHYAANGSQRRDLEERVQYVDVILTKLETK
jgi:hypothetical protein